MPPAEEATECGASGTDGKGQKRKGTKCTGRRGGSRGRGRLHFTLYNVLPLRSTYARAISSRYASRRQRSAEYSEAPRFPAAKKTPQRRKKNAKKRKGRRGYKYANAPTTPCFSVHRPSLVGCWPPRARASAYPSAGVQYADRGDILYMILHPGGQPWGQPHGPARFFGPRPRPAPRARPAA